MITFLFWPDEHYTYFKLHFMLYKKRRWGSKRFSLRGPYYHILHILSNITSLVDPDRVRYTYFCRIQIVLASRACPCGSGQSIKIPIKFIFYFAMKISICCPKYLKIMTHLPLIWKELYFNLPLLWIKVKKFSPNFSKCVKLGKGSAFGSALFWCQSGIQTRIWDWHQNGKSNPDPDRHQLIKMMPIHNTEYYIYNTVPAHS